MLRTRTRKIALSFRLFVFLSVTLVYVLIGSASSKSSSTDDVSPNQSLDRNSSFGRHLLAIVNGVNCTPPAINEFPSDGLTREQRQHGWIVIHVIIACYLFMLLAIVCDDFFVPAIKKFCDRLHMSEDVAGATFMAVASSSSELFINSVGTFVTQGDIGIGTILGSAVFNILAVPACCGLVSNMVVDLEWWPLTRDSLMYGSSVIMLIVILQDGKVELYEACILVAAYAVYIAVICFTKQISNCLNRLIRRCKNKKKYTELLHETHPLLGRSEKNSTGHMDHKSIIDSELTLQDCEDLEESTNIWEWPQSQSPPGKAWWVLTWPISFFLYITIPDCRKHPRLYVCTFLMCIFWIGTTSYTVAWLITVIGDTVNIPDSVMGLTFLAAGTSVPEAVSSVIVTNQGHGAMGLSSSIGSNTFDILLCLGLPWTIKSWLYPKIPGEHSIIINSSGITYSAFCLLSTLLLLYFSISLNRFKLDWKIGLTCLLMYLCFLTIASLVELNTFFPVNLPTCDR